MRDNRPTVIARVSPEEAAEAVIAMGSFAASRGWVPATSGNFSARIDQRRIAVTRSGPDKGSLVAADVLVLDLAEPIPAGVSAEAPLHVARYRSDPSIGAIAHVHTVAATVLSRGPQPFVRLEGYEMQKALPGVRTHDGAIDLPVFPNNQDTAELAVEVERAISPDGPPGYLIGGHGIYAWGADAAQTCRHLEALEFLLACALEERRLNA